GVLDTGINPSNPSFAATVPVEDGGDGYEHMNPLGEGVYLGTCDPANTDQYDERFACNDKLIGAWDFSGDGPFDADGHGSHTASTVAGNQVDAVVTGPSGISDTRTISGVAPHANLIAYDVCNMDGCSMAATTAAIDQAIADGVDVINYSIGGWLPSAAWSDPDTLGFLNARAAGIFVATAAGNDGPWAESIGAPADIPWVTAVAASTHDRSYTNTVTDLTREDGTGPPDIEGLGFAAARPPLPHPGPRPHPGGRHRAPRHRGPRLRRRLRDGAGHLRGRLRQPVVRVGGLPGGHLRRRDRRLRPQLHGPGRDGRDPHRRGRRRHDHRERRGERGRAQPGRPRHPRRPHHLRRRRRAQGVAGRGDGPHRHHRRD